MNHHTTYTCDHCGSTSRAWARGTHEPTPYGWLTVTHHDQPDHHSRYCTPECASTALAKGPTT